jgi:hypothetical protein
MKIVCLDVDGVMNSIASNERVKALRAQGDPHINDLKWASSCFAPWSVEALNRITTVTGASIVISSSWRRGAIPFLRRWGVLGDIIGATPRFDYEHTRGQEIAAWLESFAKCPGTPEITSLVILDDDADMAPFMDRLVQTSHYERGLTAEHAERAIELLIA